MKLESPVHSEIIPAADPIEEVLSLLSPDPDQEPAKWSADIVSHLEQVSSFSQSFGDMGECFGGFGQNLGAYWILFYKNMLA